MRAGTEKMIFHPIRFPRKMLALLCLYICLAQLINAGTILSSLKKQFSSSEKEALYPCKPTDFGSVVSCTAVPKDAQVFDLQNGFKTFVDSEGRIFRQVDMASYFFYQRRIPAYLTRLRHPYLLLADPKVPIGSDVIEIEWSKKFDFYVSIDQSDRKPRIANQVSKQLGFQRDLQCFTSANGAEIAQAMDEFSKIYRTFLNNCVHMIRHLLHRLCGPQVAKKAGKRLFNIIMYLGEKFPQKSHSTKQPMPYVITPPGSTSTYDMREVISSSSLANLLELSNVNDDEGFFEGDEDM